MTTLLNDWFNPNLGLIKVNLWHGGEMPVEDGTRILVVHRDGEMFITRAGNEFAEDWEHTNEAGDIVAYAFAPCTDY